MRDLIIDTDVISFLFKEDTRGDLYQSHLTGAISSISFMTLAELEQWTKVRNWGTTQRNKLRSFIKDRFVIAHSSPRLCRKWADVRDQTRRSGIVIQPSGAWIAATALIYNVPLVTHNADDFTGITGLTVISESKK